MLSKKLLILLSFICVVALVSSKPWSKSRSDDWDLFERRVKDKHGDFFSSLKHRYDSSSDWGGNQDIKAELFLNIIRSLRHKRDDSKSVTKLFKIFVKVVLEKKHSRDDFDFRKLFSHDHDDWSSGEWENLFDNNDFQYKFEDGIKEQKAKKLFMLYLKFKAHYEAQKEVVLSHRHKEEKARRQFALFSELVTFAEKVKSHKDDAEKFSKFVDLKLKLKFTSFKKCFYHGECGNDGDKDLDVYKSGEWKSYISMDGGDFFDKDSKYFQLFRKLYKFVKLVSHKRHSHQTRYIYGSDSHDSDSHDSDSHDSSSHDSDSHDSSSHDSDSHDSDSHDSDSHDRDSHKRKYRHTKSYRHDSDSHGSDSHDSDSHDSDSHDSDSHDSDSSEDNDSFLGSYSLQDDDDDDDLKDKHPIFRFIISLHKNLFHQDPREFFETKELDKKENNEKFVLFALKAFNELRDEKVMKEKQENLESIFAHFVRFIKQQEDSERTSDEFSKFQKWQEAKENKQKLEEFVTFLKKMAVIKTFSGKTFVKNELNEKLEHFLESKKYVTILKEYSEASRVITQVMTALLSVSLSGIVVCSLLPQND